MTGLSDEQHAVRLPRWPASEGAGLLGLNPYGPPMDWWELHMGLKEFEGDPEMVETGLDMEDGIARGCARTLKWGRMERSKTLIHPEGWACATPDRLFPKHQRGMQIKNHGPHMVRTYKGRPGSVGEWDNNLVPLAYLIQCIFEMVVVQGALGWKLDRWCLGAYFGGANRRPYILRWDPVTAQKLWSAAYLFWQKHIDPGGPQEPPYDAVWHVGPEAPHQKRPKASEDALLTDPLPTFR